MNEMYLYFAFLIFLAIPYFFGSIPSGLILTKIFLKQDIRKIGSGNIGTTNVLRTGNKKLALATLLLDASKGAIVILIFVGFPKFTSPIFNMSIFGQLPTNIQFTVSSVIALLAIIGHCFPVHLGYRGGKGVATALGSLLVAVPYAGLSACFTWIFVAFLFKISSLAALISTAVVPFVTYYFYGIEPARICALITLLIWVRHKDNIKRLLKGEEPKIGKKKKEETVDPVSE